VQKKETERRAGCRMQEGCEREGEEGMGDGRLDWGKEEKGKKRNRQDAKREEAPTGIEPVISCLRGKRFAN
jgi:TATA-binding protein-associated factor Taf7